MERLQQAINNVNDYLKFKGLYDDLVPDIVSPDMETYFTEEDLQEILTAAWKYKELAK